jgi:hypothetical protein
VSESSRIATIEAPANFRSFAAPRSHGSALIDPPLAAAGGLLAQNCRLSNNWDVQFAGTSIDALRRAARRDLLQAAIKYVRAYRDVTILVGTDDTPDAKRPSTAMESAPLVMGGHQPDLFHSGVWFKNFALSQIAMNHGAIAVNLIVDNDLSGSAAIRSPMMDNGHITRQSIAFDGPTSQTVPFEQRWIAEPNLFASFPNRLGKTLAGVVADPLVHAMWPHAIAASQRCANIGCSIAQARHALEGELGLETLELPISAACRLPAFAAFVLGIANELPRFQDCYNESLTAYRRAHSIRSNAHPVPALDEVDGWFEAPLWIYGDDDSRRRSAWVRMVGNGLEISDRNQRTLRIDRPESSQGIEQLMAAQGANFKLRPRALVTTMFARLILSDLFLHGIGGAKYDQLGDTIIQRFFGIQPPEYQVLSATVHLPGAAVACQNILGKPSVRFIQRRLRDTRFSPETFADQNALPVSLVERKQRLLMTVAERGQKKAWHDEITRLNAALSQNLTDVVRGLKQELVASKERERESQIWHSREHAFPIFPAEYLTESFQSLLHESK